jgi:hypothetical protein
VVGLECVAVGIAEGVGELLGGVRDVVAEGLGSEVEAAGTRVSGMILKTPRDSLPVQPHETLGGSVLLLLELVQNEFLQGF